LSKANRNFEIRQDRTPLFGWGPDKKWRYTDKAGHEHRYEDGYPTLKEVIEFVPCGYEDCNCDGHEISHYECPECGERIRPGVAQETHYSYGRKQYYVDGAQVPEEQYWAELRSCFPIDGK
jgi:hypothetical protein